MEIQRDNVEMMNTNVEMDNASMVNKNVMVGVTAMMVLMSHLKCAIQVSGTFSLSILYFTSFIHGTICKSNLFFSLEGRCRSGEWQCNNGDCILAKAYCDGRYDCRDYSDERWCRKYIL